jgi:hypothetical protein
MNKKILYLFLALILPGLIFIFLKRFGKNEFTIPIYFERSADSLNNVCQTRYTQPYHIPDSVLQKAAWHASPTSLFVTDSLLKDNSEMKRLSDAFVPGEFQYIGLDNRKFGQPTLSRWLSCVFMMKPQCNVVLVDSEKRIRGYYKIGSREEMDRLIMEMQILLKKY